MLSRCSIVALAVLLMAPIAYSEAPPENRAWLGVYADPLLELPEIEDQAGGAAALQGALYGLRVGAVFPDSPAEAGGILAGDIIISIFGEPCGGPPDSVRYILKNAIDEKLAGTRCPMRIIRNAITRDLQVDDAAAPDRFAQLFWRAPQEAIDSLSSGQALTAHLTKRQAVIDLEILLGLRPEARWPRPPTNAEIYAPDRFTDYSIEPLVWALAEERGLRAETEDLLDRLNRCHSGADPNRLPSMLYVHRDPFRIEAVSRHIAEEMSQAQWSLEFVAHAAPQLVPHFQSTMPLSRRLPDPAAEDATDIDALIDQIGRIFMEAHIWHRQAFAALSEDDRAFLARERWNLSDAFAEELYIHLEDDKERFAKNKRLIDLSRQVDYGALLEASLRIALLTDPEWVMYAGRFIQELFAETLDAEILLDRETPAGRILLGGYGSHWYRDLDAAFILDLGGDDTYTGNNGGNNGWEVPFSVCIDLQGNDAYESTLRSCQGTGSLGIGALIDLEGDDNYIGLQWCQGTGYFGVGWLHDLSGDDVYRGRAFCQGTGLFGIGVLLDETGDDRYEGDYHVQAVGLAQGIGALIDRAGNDEYYAKGLHPTGYRDAGIFDAWSQGCGMGFRTLASGGLGLLIDGAGRDRMEAGNFSQGGGYYYGFGILQAQGRDDDVYIGSRYNQGFSAHQALGVFLEEGGDDFYTTRQGVAQGLAWDECVTLFVDSAGNDTYQGGTFFSQGASAHNSFCFFLDRGGRDTYEYASGPARAGANHYHGGASFSLFIDEGGSRDRYAAEGWENDTYRYEPTHGFFLDLGSSWGRAFERRTWQTLAGYGERE